MENTYLNPVFPHECADPFAISYNGWFWCYRTGHGPDGKIFGILRSRDLVRWDVVGGAMDPLPDGPPFYWAPEIHLENGVFYLYYSAGNEINMHMRVATARRPQGPFIDAGRRLTSEVFAIDGHVFVDENGQRYFFYATDFLDVDRVGTGTVMDRMVDPLTLEGRPTPVTLAKYDWQIYDPRRAEKNNLRWHTVEGSFTLKRKGRYYHMFSGGNYQQKSYGVGYAVTDDIGRRVEWAQHIDGEQVFPILRTVAGEVTGPGHNSVVAGPDHRQLFCVYHVIKPQRSFERVLSIDRMEWVGDRLVVLGPTYDPQPAPNRAQSLVELAPKEATGWQVSQDAITQPEPRSAALGFDLEIPAFLFHGWIRLLESSQDAGEVGVSLRGTQGELARFSFHPAARALEIRVEGGPEARLALPEAFDPLALHRWKIDVNHREIVFQLDEIDHAWRSRLPAPATRLELWTEAAAAEFAAPDLTYGWEDLFTGDDPSPQAAGWVQQGEGSWRVSGGLLRAQGAPSPSWLVKETALRDYEWVVNFRVAEGSALWLYPALRPGTLPTPQEAMTVGIEGGTWALRPPSGEAIPLPPEFNGFQFQQIRFRKVDGQVRVWWLDHELGAWPAPEGETCTVLGVDAAAMVEFDMARLTKL